MMVVMVTCHCRNDDMVMIMVLATASPRQARNRSLELSRGPFCAVVRAERGCGHENLPGARLGLVLDGFSSWTRRW
eukprot:2466413-Alexandrium_andersonii.AAC.1